MIEKVRRVGIRIVVIHIVVVVGGIAVRIPGISCVGTVLGVGVTV